MVGVKTDAGSVPTARHLWPLQGQPTQRTPPTGGGATLCRRIRTSQPTRT